MIEQYEPTVRHSNGRRRWDLPPNLTKVLLAWAVCGPAVVAALAAVLAKS